MHMRDPIMKRVQGIKRQPDLTPQVSWCWRPYVWVYSKKGDVLGEAQSTWEVHNLQPSRHHFGLANQARGPYNLPFSSMLSCVRTR